MSFYTDVLMKDARFNSTNTISDVSLLEPGTRAAVAAIIADAKAMGHDLRVGETYRSQARQRYLFTKGLTKLKNVGAHGFGTACDFHLFVNGEYEGDGQKYLFLGGLCRKHAMISGYDWGFPNKAHDFRDYDHVQRITLARQPALFAHTWFPAPDYNPYHDPESPGVS